MAKRVILSLFIFASMAAVGYYFQSKRHAECAERGGTWVSTSTKSGYCNEQSSDGVVPDQ